MSAVSRYWRLIRIDAAGNRKAEEIALAKAFFLSRFPQFASGGNLPDAGVQRQLLSWFRSNLPETDISNQNLAEMCLRCLISNSIEQACIQLETNFGSNHGFTRYDLFPLVLTDVATSWKQKSALFQQGTLSSTTYTSLATEILQTFEPERSSLATWTTRLVKHHRELKAFLVEHGVYLISDWAILNDTTPKQLQRIFLEFHQLTEVEIEQAAILLESYHAVYRRDRLASRLAGNTGQCPIPTPEQLHQIAQAFQNKTQRLLKTQEIFRRLQDIAEQLRQYRIHVQRGSPLTESLDDPNLHSIEPRIHTGENLIFEAEQIDFLAFYRQQFIDCLDQALAKVTRDRLTSLQRKDFQQAQQFLMALHLFHCQGQSMGEIAPLIGLQAQYQVTRLLKLKDFRALVRQTMIETLLPCILEKAIAHTDPERLQALDQQVESALNEQISQLIQEVETEGTKSKNLPFKSLFAKRLCQQIKLSH